MILLEYIQKLLGVIEGIISIAMANLYSSDSLEQLYDELRR